MYEINQGHTSLGENMRDIQAREGIPLRERAIKWSRTAYLEGRSMSLLNWKVLVIIYHAKKPSCFDLLNNSGNQIQV